MQHRYLPAMLNNNGLDFFHDDFAFRRPQALFSYALWSMGPRLKRLPAEVLAPDDRFIFGDSGGFSIVSQGVNLDPVSVIRWQRQNTDVGVILDVPPYRISGKSYKGAADIWKDSIERTTNNVQKALRHYHPEDEPFRWWGVIQGESYDRMLSWHDQVAEIYPFTGEGEGWAIKPTPDNDFNSMARAVKFIHEHDVDRAHLLMTTGVRTVAVLIGLLYLKGPIELLTYDSASAGIFAGNRHAWKVSDDGLTLQEWFPRVYTPEIYLTMPCECVACARYKALDQPTEVAVFNNALFLHNNIMLFEFFDRISEEAEEDAEGLLRKYLGDRYGQVIRTYEYGDREEQIRPNMTPKRVDGGMAVDRVTEKAQQKIDERVEEADSKWTPKGLLD